MYLHYLESLGIEIRDVKKIISRTPLKIKIILEYLVAKWKNDNPDRFAAVKIFSDVMRMLIMTGCNPTFTPRFTG